VKFFCKILNCSCVCHHVTNIAKHLCVCVCVCAHAHAHLRVCVYGVCACTCVSLRDIRSRMLRFTGYVAHMGKKRNGLGVSLGITEG
jgi:hypothetical protein